MNTNSINRGDAETMSAKQTVANFLERCSCRQIPAARVSVEGDGKWYWIACDCGRRTAKRATFAEAGFAWNAGDLQAGLFCELDALPTTGPGTDFATYHEP